MSKIFETEILIPHIVYQKNPIKAIKGLLGNDVNIISYTISDVMTTNEEFLIKVVYSSVDFSPFEIYKVKDVKRINTNSDKYIGILCCDSCDSSCCDSCDSSCDSKDNSKTNKESTKESPKKTYIKLNQNVKECYVKINTLTQNNIDEDIIYYGDIITSIQDIMTNFCSAFDTVKLSYHGTNIPINIPQDVVVSSLVDVSVLNNFDILNGDSRENSKKKSTKESKKESKKESNKEQNKESKEKPNKEPNKEPIRESQKDKEIFDKFQSMSHDYSRNYFDISYLKQQISNKVYVLSPESVVKQQGIYSFENLSLNQLKDVLMKTKTGIFFLMAERTNPFYFIYIPNHEMSIRYYIIEHMITVISKDLENLILLNKN